MFDRTDIRAAVEAGVISEDGAQRLEAFLKSRNDPDRMLDPENLRFLSNFNDVFLTIGICVLMTGLGFLSVISLVNLLGLPGTDPTTVEEGMAFAARLKLVVLLAPLSVVLAAWLLAEYFCGRRRLLLPSMALSLAIVGASALSAAGLASLFISDYTLVSRLEADAFDPVAILSGMSYAGFAAGVVALIILPIIQTFQSVKKKEL